MWLVLLAARARAGDLDLTVSLGDDTARLVLTGVAPCAWQELELQDDTGRWKVRVLAAGVPEGRVWSRVEAERTGDRGRFATSPSFLALDGEPARVEVGGAVSLELAVTGMEPGSCVPPEVTEGRAKH